MDLTTLFAFVFVLGVVVVVHEAGHFFVAKAVGVWCKVFSVGFGPKLLRKQIGETEYALSAIPFGGYVKMAGEGALEDLQDMGSGAPADDIGPGGESIPPERFFTTKNTWQRMAVIVAGPAMNLVLALGICIGLIWANGVTYVPELTLGWVDEGGPAEVAGLQVGDRLIALDGVPVESFNDVANRLRDAVDEGATPVSIGFLRGAEQLNVSLTPEVDDETGLWSVGMRPRQTTKVGKVWRDGPAHRAGIRTGDVIVAIEGQPVTEFSQIADVVNEAIGEPLHVVWERDGRELSADITPEADERMNAEGEIEEVGRIFFEPYTHMRQVGFAEAAMLGGEWTWGMASQTVGFLKVLLSGGASRDSVSGPLRIAQFSGEMIRWGFDYLLRFLALFSVNLCILNLLPIPVLDGGQAMFVLYEMILGRRPNLRVQMVATQVGFVLLLLVMAWVLTMDVLNLVS